MHVIPIHAEKVVKPCRFRETCPIYLNSSEQEIEAAVYTIITASGKVLNGAHKVKPHHMAELRRALDRLTARLHDVLAA